MTNFVTYHVGVPQRLSDRLEEIAGGPGVSKTAIIRDALRAFVERKGSGELELRFAERLDQISRQLSRIERVGRIEIESLAIFVRYMLSVTAPVPDDDDASRAIGMDRFNAFIERVARQCATGRLTFVPEDVDR